MLVSCYPVSPIAVGNGNSAIFSRPAGISDMICVSVYILGGQFQPSSFPATIFYSPE